MLSGSTHFLTCVGKQKKIHAEILEQGKLVKSATAMLTMKNRGILMSQDCPTDFCETTQQRIGSGSF